MGESQGTTQPTWPSFRGHFPKSLNLIMLSTQLYNFAQLIESLEVPDDKKDSKLPEVLSGPVSRILKNIHLPTKTTFADAKYKLLVASGLTVTQCEVISSPGY